MQSIKRNIAVIIVMVCTLVCPAITALTSSNVLAASTFVFSSSSTTEPKTKKSTLLSLPQKKETFFLRESLGKNKFLSKNCELSSHLANVKVVISDEKVVNDLNASNTVDNSDSYEPLVLSYRDYFAFGQEMPSRKYNVSNKYRYGFNGKEDDDDNFGRQDYGLRIYDVRIGKFLSNDPLGKDYPWNSPYSFAENDAIRCIDLDGAEKIKTNIISKPADGKPGVAKITIMIDYKVITKGDGAVNAALINTQAIKDKYAKGNTTLYLKNLPSTTEIANVATSSEIRNVKDGKPNEGDVYVVDVEYQINIIKDDGTDINSALKWLNEDRAGRGVIYIPLPIVPPQEAYDKGKDYYSLYSFGKYASKRFATGTGLEVAASGMNPSLGHEFNAVVLNNTFFNSEQASFKIPGTNGLTNSGVITHEIGHNMAAEFVHGNNYEYSMRGLSSNNDSDIYPTKDNTIKIINDNDNRQTIKP